MRFLDEKQCADWCHRYGYLTPSNLREAPSPELYAQHKFNIPADSNNRIGLCRLLWGVTDGQVADRLLWINQWSVWPSGEHMSLFTRWRAGFGETRTLIQARGHQLEENDDEDGLSVLILACLFLWDCWMYSEGGIIIELSHDEYGVLYEPRDVLLPERRAALAEFGVLINP